MWTQLYFWMIYTAACTGDRLKTLEIPWTDMIWSTMTRAQETGTIISKALPSSPKVVNCSLIEEGAPIPPEPPIGHWRPEDSVNKQTILLLNSIAFITFFYHLFLNIISSSSRTVLALKLVSVNTFTGLRHPKKRIAIRWSYAMRMLFDILCAGHFNYHQKLGYGYHWTTLRLRG